MNVYIYGGDQLSISICYENNEYAAFAVNRVESQY